MKNELKITDRDGDSVIFIGVTSEDIIKVGIRSGSGTYVGNCAFIPVDDIPTVISFLEREYEKILKDITRRKPLK